MKTTAVRRILVPVDLSPCSRAALEFARSLGASLGSSLEVLFVLQPDETGDQPVAEAAAKEELHRFVTSAGGAAVAISERITTGDARERIVAIAEKEGFDVIVLGTHGRTGRARSLAGSVAESVVRTASQPVVTVRES